MSDAQQGSPDAGQQTDAPAEDANGQQAADSKFPPEVQAILDKANREAASFRKRAAAAEAKISEFEQANMSDLEKREQKIKALEEELTKAQEAARASSVRAEITAAATKLGFRNPKVAHRLLDLGKVSFNDAGEPENVDRLLSEVLREDPYLAANGSADGGRGRTPTEQESMNDRIRSAAGRH